MIRPAMWVLATMMAPVLVQAGSLQSMKQEKEWQAKFAAAGKKAEQACGYKIEFRAMMNHYRDNVEALQATETKGVPAVHQALAQLCKDADAKKLMMEKLKVVEFRKSSDAAGKKADLGGGMLEVRAMWEAVDGGFTSDDVVKYLESVL